MSTNDAGRVKITVWGLILVLCLSLWGCQAQTEQTVRIGVLVPLSGDLVATHGRPTLEGIELAAAVVNEEGGVLIDGERYLLELVVANNQDNAQTAVAEAERLINQEKVVALVGLPLSRNAIPVAQIAEAAGIPLISAKSTNPETTRDKSYVFRVPFTDTFQGEVLARFGHEVLLAERAAVLYDIASDYNRGLAESFRDGFEQLGGQVVAFESYTTDVNNDFRPQLERISASKADVLFLPNYLNDVPLQATQARNLGIEATILGGDAWDGAVLQNEPALAGAFFSKLWDPAIETGLGSLFIERYVARYGQVPEEGAAAAYDSIGLLVAGMRIGGGIEPADIQRGLRAGELFEGVTGTIQYIDGGDPARTVFILRVTAEGTRFEQEVPPVN
ncbi:MAG TPA: ABC transporter substrate-binding protein [Anaerolineae bacterium]|nr:ABC transporter substrate-binding protein [Anaerolineae bacterium]